jgi:hypothetical protein
MTAEHVVVEGGPASPPNSTVAQPSLARSRTSTIRGNVHADNLQRYSAIKTGVTPTPQPTSKTCAPPT